MTRILKYLRTQITNCSVYLITIFRTKLNFRKRHFRADVLDLDGLQNAWRAISEVKHCLQVGHRMGDENFIISTSSVLRKAITIDLQLMAHQSLLGPCVRLL
jgi:hypothetical protein